jgi:hypothetical protein
MIIMIRQLFDADNNIEKLELGEKDFLQLQQIKDFQPDIIVGTCAEDSLLVLELAMAAKVSYAIFEPKLAQIEDTLRKTLADEYRQCGKIIYLQKHDQVQLEIEGSLVHTFHKVGELMIDGDYMDACEQMAFDSIYWGVQVIS